MNKISEVIEEKFSIMMCDFQKAITLLKLAQEIPNMNFEQKDYHNLLSIIVEQNLIVEHELQELEKLMFENNLVDKNFSC